MQALTLSIVLCCLLTRTTFTKTIQTTFSNSNQYYFDTDGNLIDATNGKIDFLNGSYIWYANSFSCGSAFCGIAGGCSAAFCGIKSWSSSDLVTWSYNGYLFDPNGAGIQDLCSTALAGNCGRPHILYSEATGKYVLWVNAGSPGYAVFTSTSSTGGFVLSKNRALIGYQPSYTQGADFSVEVINGKGYLVNSLIDFSTVGASIWPPFLQSMYVQELTPDFLNTTGPSTHAVSSAGDMVDYECESPDIFYREPYFYIQASNTCGFCQGTTMIIFRSKNITGPWTRQIISADSCGGQACQVLPLLNAGDNSTTYVAHSELFGDAPLPGIRSATHGHQFQVLSFNHDGSVADLDCSPTKSFEVAITQGDDIPTTGRAVSATDSSPIDTAYTAICDMPYYQLYQTWTSSKTGTLKEVGVNLAGDNPNANTTITVFRYQDDTNFFTPRYIWETLATADIPPTNISQSLDVVRVQLNSEVSVGDRLGIALVSNSITPMCTGRATHGEISTQKLFANGVAQVSYRGPQGKTPPVVELTGQEIKWYAIVE